MKNGKKITDDLYILEVIRQGYRLPLKESPPSVLLKDNKSARENKTFVQEDVESLIKNSVVSQVQEIPKVVNPLTVAYNKNGKPRLVLDCRHINQYMHIFKFKYEDIKVAEDIFENGSFPFTFDLKSAYHSIGIEILARILYSNRWEGELFRVQFFAIRFIYSWAHFSMVLRVVVKFWRAGGHKMIMFLDDGIGGSVRYENA